MSILTIVGTRPEIVKLVPVVQALRSEGRIAMRVCHSGQHAELGREILTAAGIVPDEMLARPAAGDVAGLLAGLVTTIGAAIDRQKPAAVVVQGDTATTLAGTLAAFHRQVPVAHVEAGLRSGDLSRPWPEEGYRRMISPLARWHFAPTSAARDALLGERIPADTIELVGNTVVDSLRWAERRLDADTALGKAAQPLLDIAGGSPLVLATIHRRETGAVAMKAIAAGLLELVESENVHLVLPLHPRAQSDVLRDALCAHAGVSLVPALDYFAFVRLMRAARLIVSDSGGIQEEATALGRPVLILRETTERPEAVAAGAAQMVGHDGAALVVAARQALDGAMPAPSDVFGDGQAGKRIARRLLAESAAVATRD